MPIFHYPNCFQKPDQGTPIDPFDADGWEQLLHPRRLKTAEDAGFTEPEAIKKFKEDSPCFTALEFPEGAQYRREAHATRSWGLILDVDDKVVLSLDQLKERLQGTLFIAFSSFSSTPETPRWRVILPFATPAPLEYTRSIWTYVDASVFQGLAGTTRDPTRLGFYGRVRGQREKDAYQWHFNRGEPFSWTELRDAGLLAEEAKSLRQIFVPLSKERRHHWTPRHVALTEASSFYRAKYSGTEPGERHKALFITSAQLWWDWAADDDDFVFHVLQEVNNTFDPPKSQDEVEKEVEAGYKRTLEGAGETQQNDYGVRREPPTPFSIEGVRSLIQNLKNRAGRTQSEYSARMSMAADALKKAIDGKSLCNYTNVPQLTHMYYHLAEWFPRNPVESLMEFLGPSLGATRTTLAAYPDVEGALNYEVVKARLAALQAQGLVRRDQRKKEMEEEQKEELRQFFHSDRDWPYTDEEIEKWEDTCGLSPKTWFLIFKRDFFVFNQGRYQGPKTEKEFQVMMRRWALPMKDVDVCVRNEKGAVKQLKPDEVVSKYGTGVDRVEYDYGATQSRMEWRAGNGDVAGENVLVMTAGQKRALERKYSHDIDQWIRLLSGDKYEMFLDYLAGFPQTAYALPCLYLYGSTGTGKSSFAKGLSRIYRRGEPLSYEGAVQRFNDTILDTPVVLCDEFIPESVKKSGQTTAYLRNIVQKTDHMVEVKNGSVYALKGALRIIITANNLSVITDDREQLTNMDVAGTVNRFLLLEAAPETRAFLEGLEAVRFKEILDFDLAQHVLWLSENRKIDTSKRFLGICDPDSQLKSSIVTTKAVPNLMCELLTTAILSNAKGVKGIRFDDEGVYVRQELWAKNTWEMLGLDVPKISVGKMARGMSLVAHERKAFWEAGRTVNYRQVDIEDLMRWVEESSFVDPDEFREAMLRRMAEAEVLNGTNPTANGPRETQ